MTVLPLRSMTSVLLPESLPISSVVPTAWTLPPLTARAWATEKPSSTVMIFPLTRTRSASHALLGFMLPIPGTGHITLAQYQSDLVDQELGHHAPTLADQRHEAHPLQGLQVAVHVLNVPARVLRELVDGARPPLGQEVQELQAAGRQFPE